MRTRRALPFVWVLVGVLASGTALKSFLAYRMALVLELNVGSAMNVLLMSNAERVNRSFSGPEAVFVDYAMSATVYLGGCVAIGTALVLTRINVVRKAALLDLVGQLERLARANPSRESR